MLVEDGSGRSVSDFLCRNNIFLFLHALASPHNFNFEQDLLFDPEDLYLCRDIGKVFRCKIFGFFSSRSLKTREKYISFAQLILLSLYFLMEVCLLFNFTLPSKNLQTEQN